MDGRGQIRIYSRRAPLLSGRQLRSLYTLEFPTTKSFATGNSKLTRGCSLMFARRKRCVELDRASTPRNLLCPGWHMSTALAGLLPTLAAVTGSASFKLSLPTGESSVPARVRSCSSSSPARGRRAPAPVSARASRYQPHIDSRRRRTKAGIYTYPQPKVR